MDVVVLTAFQIYFIYDLIAWYWNGDEAQYFSI